MRRQAAFLAAAMLCLPPLPAQGGNVLVAVCGDAARRMAIPVGQPLPGGDTDCCKKGCHVGQDRRKRADGTTGAGCC